MYPTYRELESIVNLLNEAYTQSNEMEKLLNKEKVLRGHIVEIRHRIWDAMQSVKDLGEQ